MQPTRRRCSADTNSGAPCKAWAVHDHVLCAGHLGRGLAANPKAAAAQSAARRQEQAAVRRRRPQDVYNEALLEHAEEFAERLVDIALNGDEATALRAIEALNSRVLGRPKETVEQVEVPAELKAIREMSPDEIAALWRAHLDETEPMQ